MLLRCQEGVHLHPPPLLHVGGWGGPPSTPTGRSVLPSVANRAGVRHAPGCMMSLHAQATLGGGGLPWGGMWTTSMAELQLHPRPPPLQPLQQPARVVALHSVQTRTWREGSPCGGSLSCVHQLHTDMPPPFQAQAGALEAACGRPLNTHPPHNATMSEKSCSLPQRASVKAQTWGGLRACG